MKKNHKKLEIQGISVYRVSLVDLLFFSFKKINKNGKYKFFYCKNI